MFKMIDVFGENLVQNFQHNLASPCDQFDEVLNQCILNAPESKLHDAISYFFSNNDVLDIAAALDIEPSCVYNLQQGLDLQAQDNIENTAKVVMLCLALETEMLENVHIAESLTDYPM